MRVSRGQVVQNVIGTEGLVDRQVGLVPEGPNANVGCFYGVFPSIPLP